MRTTLEQRKRQFRAIYDILYENPRIFALDLSLLLHMNRHVVTNRLEEAFNSGYVLLPHLRKRSFKNLREYMCIAHCNHSMRTYIQYVEDTNVIYHAKLLGYFNFWVTSKEKVAIDGEVIAEGYRSDYYVAHAPDHTWERAVGIIHKKIEVFDPADYVPRGYIKTHFDEMADWDTEFEMLYRECKYNLRKKETPIRTKYLISAGKMRKWYQKFPEYCTVVTRYFPDGFSAYDSHLFMFETDYEDFIVDLFSELPSSSIFFKVGNKLFLYGDVPRHFMRSVDLSKGVNRLHIPVLMEKLWEKGIIKNEGEEYSIIDYSTGKDL